VTETGFGSFVAQRPAESRAVIFGCSGPALTEDERAFLTETKPYGFILFARNVVDRAQVSALIADLRRCVGWAAPVLIDQEGGRVQRMTAPEWRKYPAGRVFGALYDRDADQALALCRDNAHLLAWDLAEVGIDVDCLPLLDLPQPGAHDVIGDRAFSAQVEPTVALARAQLEGLRLGGVTGVIKHIPGHGRAMSDSHLELPMIKADRKTLLDHDFQPFRAFSDEVYGMTGHLLLADLDGDRPSTTSPLVVEQIIRGHLAFNGLLMTDDLSMQALGGGFSDRASASIEAGCDLVLHCNGKMDEMRAVAGATPLLSGEAASRADRADARRARYRAEATSPAEDAVDRLRAALGADWPDGISSGISSGISGGGAGSGETSS
jgi:beta-N-acetylhexosaminidase